MRIGHLNKRFEVQKAGLVLDGFGLPMTAWTSQFFVWGHLALVTESMRGKSTDYSGTHLITLRFREDIETGSRLVAGERSFMVRGLYDREGTGRWLRLLVEEEARLG